jgi:hypothetical protein
MTETMKSPLAKKGLVPGPEEIVRNRRDRSRRIRRSGLAAVKNRKTVLACRRDGEPDGNPGPPCINGCGPTLDMGHCKNVCPSCGIWQTCHD